jgi:hypothetical protein
MGCLRCQIHESLVKAVSLVMISKVVGAVCVVESLCHPWKQFH